MSIQWAIVRTGTWPWAPGHCWIIDGDPDLGCHFSNLLDADEERARRAREVAGYEGKAVQLDHPCWIIACDGCGDDPSDDETGTAVMHFRTALAAASWIAEQASEDLSWTLCIGGPVFCPSCQPTPGARPAPPPARQLPGQIALFDTAGAV